VLLGLGFFSFVGFINFVTGVGAALFWLAAWWPARDKASVGRRLCLLATLPAIYLLHLSAPLTVLVILWADVAAAMLVGIKGSGKSSPWRLVGETLAAVLRSSRGRFAIASSFVIAAMCVLGGMGVAHAARRAPAFDYPPVAHKLENVLSPFYVFSIRQTVVSVAIYVAMIAAFVYTNSKVARLDRGDAADRQGRLTIGLSILALLGLYLVFPAGTPGTGYLDIRWLPIAFLLPFGLAGRTSRTPARGITTLLLLGCALNAGVLWRMMQPVEQELEDFNTALDSLPSGARVLPVIADGLRHGRRIFPYRHQAFWYVIERRGRAPMLFNGLGEGNGGAVHTFQRHFMERRHLYFPGLKWGTEEFHPLNWGRILREYDYIVEGGEDPRATEMIRKGAWPVLRVGETTVYKVGEAGGDTRFTTR
jgi:hypothetical protein